MMVQFTAHLLSNIAELRGEPGKPKPSTENTH
jgi:hypothetical protein